MKNIDLKVIRETLLRKKSLMLLPRNNNDTIYPPEFAISFINNIESLGFTASDSLFKYLMTLSPDVLKKELSNIVPILTNMAGADVKYAPLYKNFPESVMSADEAELIKKQLLSYAADAAQIYTGYNFRALIDFDGDKSEREALCSEPSYVLLSEGTIDDFKDLVRNTIKSKASVAETDKNWLEFALLTFGQEIIPDEIPNKEMVAFLAGFIIEENLNIAIPFKTPTDVLRIAVAISGGDVSLSKAPKFKSFKRKERRFLLAAFDKIFSANKNAFEEILVKKGWYERLCEKLHPSEYASRYPNAARVFGLLRKNTRVDSYGTKLEKALLDEDIDTAISLLEKKPGVFARKLDHILRIADKLGRPADVLNSFNRVADKVDTPVLWTVKQHFLNRNSERVAVPKGSISNSYLFSPKHGYEMSEDVAFAASEIASEAISRIYSNKETLAGKTVYLSDEINGFTVPSALRSTSRALRTVGRGSRIPVKHDSDCLRAFVYWKGNFVDLDLAAAFLDESYGLIESVDYMNLKTKYACHSGDITSAPKGDSEFVDVSISKVKEVFDGKLKKECKYIAFLVHSYSMHFFSDLEQAFFGVMEREGMNNVGEIYEPTTVKFKFDLTARSHSSLSIIYDVDNDEFIWADCPFDGNKQYSPNNSISGASAIVAVTKGVVDSPKIPLSEVFEKNCVARGATFKNAPEWEEERVLDDGSTVIVTKKADIIFDIDGTITPYDSDIILGEWL